MQSKGISSCVLHGAFMVVTLHPRYSLGRQVVERACCLRKGPNSVGRPCKRTCLVCAKKWGLRKVHSMLLKMGSKVLGHGTRSVQLEHLSLNRLLVQLGFSLAGVCGACRWNICLASSPANGIEYTVLSKLDMASKVLRWSVEPHAAKFWNATGSCVWPFGAALCFLFGPVFFHFGKISIHPITDREKERWLCRPPVTPRCRPQDREFLHTRSVPK